MLICKNTRCNLIFPSFRWKRGRMHACQEEGFGKIEGKREGAKGKREGANERRKGTDGVKLMEEGRKSQLSPSGIYMHIHMYQEREREREREGVISPSQTGQPGWNKTM